MNTTARKFALTLVLAALVCPWLSLQMHALAVKAAVVNIPPSVNLRSYANTLSRGHAGKDLRARARAIRTCLNWEDALWVFALILGGAGVVLYVRNPSIKIFDRRQYAVELPGSEGVTLNQASWYSRFALFVHGAPAAAGEVKRSFRIPRDDGTEAQVALAWTFFDVPRLRVGNETMRVVPPLDWFRWGVIIFPLVLLFIGGALGGAVGGAGGMINARIVRCEAPKTLQLFLAGCTIILSFVCYIAGLLLFAKMFRR